MSFIRLSGSERVLNVNINGNLINNSYINKSLAAMSDIISSLTNKSKHIPYRNSKLTYLFSHALGGNWNTIYIGTISSASHSWDETLCTLRYLNRVKACKNYPKQNINDKYSLLVQIDRIYHHLTIINPYKILFLKLYVYKKLN